MISCSSGRLALKWAIHCSKWRISSVNISSILVSAWTLWAQAAFWGLLICRHKILAYSATYRGGRETVTSVSGVDTEEECNECNGDGDSNSVLLVTLCVVCVVMAFGTMLIFGIQAFADIWQKTKICRDKHTLVVEKGNQGQNQHRAHPTTTNHIRIALIVGIQCKENREIDTARGWHAWLSKGGVSGMDHDQEKMRMGTECVGCNIVRREEISDIVRRSWGWGGEISCVRMSDCYFARHSALRMQRRRAPMDW